MKTTNRHLVKPLVYDDLHREEQFSKYSCLLEIIGNPQGDLLDVGCGTALLHEYLKERGVEPRRYVCLDPEPGMLWIAARKLNKISTAIIILGYAEDLPVRSGSFDWVVSISTWGALEDPRRALSEAERTIKSGGTVVFTGYPRTFSMPPSAINPLFELSKICIDKFYVYKRQSSINGECG